ncbi:MAG TPA: sugar phosphate isomerase/epimerase [Planctomycetota bacterium]|jgi:sugar phosphate isomerase/epimerase|nr:sugar phosphate isomerase/epimerase [Planctomycetota bacterium]
MTPEVSRRSFLLGAAAATGAAGLHVPRVLPDAREESRKKYGGFAMGIQSYSLRGFPFEPAIERVGELGLHWVEFYDAHLEPTEDPVALAAMRRRLERFDLSISAHGVNRFGDDHEANERLFRFARAAGIPNLSADFGPDAHGSLEKLVAKYAVRIAAHNHGPGHRWAKVEDLLKQIGGLDPRIGACADLGHFLRAGEDPLAAIRALKGRLYGIHLKDFAAARGDAKGCVLGKGVLDVKGAFRALKEVGFPADGALSLEYEENPKDPMADLKESLAAAAEAARSAAGS